jgi:iron complex outermembrane receptor protein
VRTPSPESKPATEVGSSQYGAGPGGRFTGYTVDYDAPAMAGKDNTPILQTPANVQVVTRQAMDDRQDISVRDAIVGYVSSVQPPSNTPSSNNFYDGFNIRGFDNVNIYRNNLRVWELTGIQTSNLQSIEILKGPAAMLYGRLEPGGIVDLIPKRPLDYSYTSIQQQFGSWGLSRTTIDTTGPVTADKTWLYRVNLAYDRADSFIDFVNSKNVFIAPTLTFRPNDQFRFNIDYEYQHSEFVDKSMGIPAVGNRPAPVPISRYLQEPAYTQANPNTQDRHLVGFDWTYDFNKDWSLTNRFAFNDQRYGQHQYGTASFTEATGVVDRWIWDANIQARTFATNLDLKGKLWTGPVEHALLVGVDYFNLTKNIQTYFNPTQFDPTIGSINIYNPVYGQSAYGGAAPNTFYPLRESWSGVYGQDTISFLDNRFHVLLGGRYDWANYGSGYGFDSQEQAEGPYDPNTGAGFLSAKAQAFSPRAGLVVQPTPWLSLYANYTKGLGVQDALPVPGSPAIPPETSRQYEAGIKAELLDKRLTASAAVFDIVKTNITQALGGAGFSIPIGEVRSRGFEFDLNGRIDSNWSVIASYSYTDARIVNGQGPDIQDVVGGLGSVYFTPVFPSVSENGNRLLNVPYNSGAVWGKYDAHGPWEGLSAAAGVVAVGERQGDNQNSFQLPAYARVDTMLQYRFKPPVETQIKTMTLQLNVKNVFGTNYYESSSNRLIIFPGAPRTFLGSIRAEL